MLKVNDSVLFTAQGYANAETVGSVDGCTVFVPYLVAGEQATIRINYVKGNVAYGRVTRLIAPSPLRVQPACPHYGKCGGCLLMHMNYNEQLAFKRNKVAANLLKIGGVNADVLPCVPSDKICRYRNKLSLPVSGKRGNVRIGMYERNTHNVVDVPDCLLGGDWSAQVVELFRNYCNTYGVNPYNERDFSGDVRHLVARYVDGQLLVTVVSNGDFSHDLRPFADALGRRFDKFGLFVNVNNNRNNVILGKTTQHVCGQQYIEGNALGVVYRLRPNSFFQVNDGVRNAVYTKVRQLLQLANVDVLVDCFSGVGILTNILSDPSRDTYGIEIEPSAVRDADEMTAINRTRVRNICGDVNVHLGRIVNDNAGKRIALVFDPPRKGLGDNICAAAIASQAHNIVYISCDSATLARDLRTLSAAYRAEYIQPFDMFPNTDQVETVVSLTRRQ